jgi:uncharacterized repeat protein (TIGR01451 family)
MRLNRHLIIFLIVAGLVVTVPAPLEAADEAVCYAAADGPNHLVSSFRTGGGFDDIGAFGVGGIEAIAFNLDNSVLYGTNGGTLGSINTVTGAFTAIAAAGSGDGALGNITMTDLDGLAFDPTNGFLYGAERQTGDDLLVRLDPVTGALVQDAFGPGVDYVVIFGSPVTGFDDIDDITVDPTDGQMYGISNDGGTGDHLVKIDKTDGSVIDVGAFLGTDDMEGLSVSPDGNIFGTTGNGGGNSLWDIDKLTGFATFVFAYPGGITDMEGVACLRSNVITGTVFVDSDSGGDLDPGELGMAGVTVRLYRDNNNDGQVDAGDTLIQTTVSPADGFYEFFITAIGNFVMEIDTSTLPTGWSLTTDNVEEADFTNFGNVDPDNDFGAIGPPVDLTVTKTADLGSACPGDTITYTINVANTSTTVTHTGITVLDAVPVGATYVAQSTEAMGWTSLPVGNYRDDFDTVAYNNSDGSLNWTGIWTENFDDGLPGSGNIMILPQDGRNALRLQSSSVNIVREVNLDPAVYNTATLTIEYERVDFEDATEFVELGIWNGIGWTIIDTFAGPANDTGWILAKYDITPYMATNTRVAFRTSAAMSTGDDFFLDYADITVGIFGIGTKDNIPAGANGDLLDGVPSNLLGSGDSFFIPPRGRMRVVFRATVDNPYNGTSPLINSATATSTEGGFDVDSARTTITLATIGNLVWHEFHPNGFQDSSEPGIPDVPITLYGPGPDGNLGTGDDVYVSSTFTDANGIYSFPNIGPGDYRVDINEAWLTASGYPVRRYPVASGYWDLDGSDLPAVACGDSQPGADFGYWDGTTVPVTLSSFRATEGRGGTLFEWTTATQVGTVGFNLLAVTDSGWRRINSELIPAHTPDSTTPQHYRYEAEDVDTESFAIEDVDIQGQRRRHGPFARDLQHGLDPLVSPERPIDWSSIRGEHRQKAEERGLSRNPQGQEGGFPAAKGANASARRAGDRRMPWGKIAQLSIETDGVYRVSHENLIKAGIDLAGISADRIALSMGGKAVPIFVRGGPVFAPGSSIEWVGFGLNTLYTKTNIYVLSLDRRNVSRVGVDWRPPQEGVSPPEYYLETTTAERNRSYSFAAPNGDPWYDTAILAFTEPKSADFEISIDKLVEDAAPATLRVEMWGTTNWPEAPDHHVEVGFNGVPVADEIFDGLQDYPLEIELPAGVLEEGTNTLELTLPGDTGVAYDMVTFDRFSVTYPRRFVARDGRLEFTAAGEVLRVEGLPSPNAVVYRRQGDVVTLVAGKEMTQEADGYVATFRGSSEPARYLVTATPAIGMPHLERVHDGSSVLEGEADYLVISHPDFIGGLDSLVNAREKEGWRVKVADVEDVYAEFSHGIVDPEALRSYISYAAEHLETEMVLLVGGDTYDYHDYLGLGSLSFIPSLYVATGEIVQFTPADPLFTDIDGDSLPDLAIGRLPVRTSDELEMVVDKTLDYAAKSYPRTGVFAADKDDASGESFTAISNAFISELPEGWTVVTAYLEQRSLESAQRRLIREFNRGTSLASYFGHSGPTVWSFDSLFHVSDALLLENHRMPTVVTQWGCWNNYYVEPTYDTMGHALLLSGDQGAAAVLGASTLTQSASDRALGESFIPRLVAPGATIGGALQEAKEELAHQDPERLDVILGWTLLGDPALVVDPQ